LFSWRLEAFTLSGGQTVSVPSRGVLLLIGPNGGGKSLCLRGLSRIGTPGLPNPAVLSVRATTEGTTSDFENWLDRRFLKRSLYGKTQWWTLGGSRIGHEQVNQMWSSLQANPGQPMTMFFVHYLSTESRLGVGNATQSVALYDSEPSGYLQFLQLDESIRQRVSDELNAAFGVDLLINWGGGPQVWCHVGAEPPRDTSNDRVSESYVAALNRLPKLDSHGDGIRSYVAAMLALHVGGQPLLLIDEPELFLHPPHARRLGACLARAANER
jgi:hypothetical protein